MDKITKYLAKTPIDSDEVTCAIANSQKCVGKVVVFFFSLRVLEKSKINSGTLLTFYNTKIVLRVTQKSLMHYF